MPDYVVENRVTKQKALVAAASAQEACAALGYMIGDCWVRQVIDSSKSGLTGPSEGKEGQHADQRTD